MANIFSTSVSGLLAFQRALTTTSHNISNINTDGYSRQRVEFGARPAMDTGSGFIGTGVNTTTVQRLVDQNRELALRNAASEHARHGVLAEFTGRIDNLLADKQAGLSPELQGFFDALQDVANDPASSSAREVLLSQAESLTSRFQLLNRRLDDLSAENNNRIRTELEQINQHADNIARLNREIVAAQGRTGQPPNDLLDQRGLELKKLSELVGTSVVSQEDGQVNVFIGNGQSLVSGGSASRMSVQPNEFDPSVQEVVLQGSSRTVRVTGSLSGGSLGGLLEFRGQVLEPTRNELGRIAASVATAVNSQHQLGRNLEGDIGLDFFRVSGPQVLPRSSNSDTITGSPDVAFDADTIGELTGSDYRLSYDGAQWTLTRLADREEFTLAPGDTLTVDGMTISEGSLGGAQAGDSFLIRPTRQAAANIDVALTRPGQIAAGSPVTGGERLVDGQPVNGGDGAIGQLEVTSLDGLPLPGEVRLVYDPAEGGYVAYDAADTMLGVLPYDPATDNNGRSYPDSAALPGELEGLRFQLSGRPEAGDTLVIGNSVDNAGDNTNALALARIADQTFMEGGNATIQESYSGLVGRVGTQTLRANANLEAQKTLLQQAEAAREEVSGVNLEEEAANLLRFQQAFQASAQVVTVANTMFQTILDAVQR